MRLPVELINGWISQGSLWPLLAAPFVGSFLGVLILRLPEGRPVVAARSACEACGHVLGAAELVPILSYLVQHGRCRSCGARIAPFHLQVELAATLVAASAATQAAGALLWWSCVLGWTLLALAWTDARSWRLPDVLTLPLIAAGLAEAWSLEPDALPDRALGALTGYAAFWLVAALYRRTRKREGLGQGDWKLAASGGAWAGAGALGELIFVGAAAGLAWALLQRLRGQAMTGETRIPFGAFLAFGIWVAWLYPTSLSLF